MNNLFDISGKVAIVTGGAETLGSSISESLSMQGTKIAVLGRDISKVQREVTKIRKMGGEAMPVSADVMDIYQLKDAEKLVIENWGRIDILINTAEQNRDILLNPDGSYTQRSLNVINKTPMKRFGKMVDLNGVIIFLCFEAASFMTGTVLPVDGGFSSCSGI